MRTVDELIRSPKIRVHPRARHVLLRLTDDQGLVITVPPKFDRRRLPAIIEEKRWWIERTHREMVSQREKFGFESAHAIPRIIQLRAFDQTWHVEVEPSASPAVELIRGLLPQTIRLVGAVDDKQLCREVLRKWIKLVARRRLVPWLDRVSEELDLPYNNVGIRAQRSRWGSCSTGKRISLNCKLVFLPTRLVRYLLVHELCHTRHMNHGKRYWEKVMQYEPDFGKLDRKLKDAWAYVPPWF